MMLKGTDPTDELELLVVKRRDRTRLKQCKIPTNIRKSQADFLITIRASGRHLRASVRMTPEILPAFNG
jgi:hypothetical protein